MHSAASMTHFYTSDGQDENIKPGPLCAWTKYADTHKVTGLGEYEMMEDLKKSLDCQYPVVFQAIPVDANEKDIMENLMFSSFTLNKGIICNNQDQSGDNKCIDLQVRLCCKGSINSDMSQ